VASPTLFDLAGIRQELDRQRADWRWWVTRDDPPNGLYWADRDTAQLWVPGRLSGGAALRALVVGLSELLPEPASLTSGNVVPILRRDWHDGAGRRSPDGQKMARQVAVGEHGNVNTYRL